MVMRFQPVAAEGGSAIVNPLGSTLTLTGTPGSAAPFTAPLSDFPLSITMVPFFSTFPDQSMMPDDGMGGASTLAGGGGGCCSFGGGGWMGSSAFFAVGRLAGGLSGGATLGFF